MDIKAVYKCKLCGESVYRYTALRPDRDLEDALLKIMKHEGIDYTSVPDTIVHKCAYGKAGIAELVGLEDWD